VRRSALTLWMSALMLAVAALRPQRAQADCPPCGGMSKYHWHYDPPGMFPCPNGDAFRIHVWAHWYSCSGEYISLGNENGGPTGFCPSDPGSWWYLAQWPDGAIIGPDPFCPCTQSCAFDNREPQVCDSKEQNTSGPADDGCGDDDFTCSATDDFPVYLTSGRVETNPITAISLPTPDNINFGFTIKYGSHIARRPGVFRSGVGIVSRRSEEYTHFLGTNWADNFSDRLMINVGNGGTVVTWSRLAGIVTFYSAGWSLEQHWRALRASGSLLRSSELSFRK
jgi:hypothetical protein